MLEAVVFCELRCRISHSFGQPVASQLDQGRRRGTMQTYRVTCGFPKRGVPPWGPYNKRILLFGDIDLPSLSEELVISTAFDADLRGFSEAPQAASRQAGCHGCRCFAARFAYSTQGYRHLEVHGYFQEARALSRVISIVAILITLLLNYPAPHEPPSPSSISESDRAWPVRLRKISKVERTRSAEQWAEVAEAKAASTWHGVTKLRFTTDILGEPVSYVKTGSTFDGWKEYFLLTRYVMSPDPIPDRTEDILFARAR